MLKTSLLKHKARTYADALKELKELYGPDVVISGSSTVREPDGSRFVQIEYCLPEDAHKENPVPGNSTVQAHSEDVMQFLMNTALSMQLLRKDMDYIKTAVKALSRPSSDGVSQRQQGPNPALFDALLRRGLSSGTAAGLIKQLESELRETTMRDSAVVNGHLKLKIAAGMKGLNIFRAADQKNAIVLVGPTGAGKTTTLAKLASIIHFTMGRSVGLLTVDTYRIAAYEQLKTYADIMSVPIHVAFNEEEVKEGINAFKDKDYILVDTMGYSKKNQDLMNKLHDLLGCVQNKSVHLVMSLTSGVEELEDNLDSFRLFKYDSVILTKLDEVERHGKMYEVLHGKDVPASFLCVGQSVPEDILVAEPDLMGKVVMEGL